jgi:phospholipid transport system substrate-binding protein
MKKLVLSVVLAFLSSSAFAATPTEFVKKQTSDILTLVQKDKNVQDFKKDLNSNVKIDDVIDFPGLARTTLGKTWRTATDEQKVAFTKEFRDFLFNFYGSAMFMFKNATIEYKNETTDGTNSVVRTAVTYKDSSATKQADVTYILMKNNDSWKISDVTMDGITLSFMYRDSFSNIISKKGLDGLITDLKEKNEKNRQKNGN